MRFEISFPDQPADEAGVLAQELRLALLRSGADPSKVELIKERADAMDLGSVVSWVHIFVDAYQASRPMLEPFLPALTAVECARLLCEICAPAHSGIRIKTPRGTFKLSASETSVERLKQIFDTAGSDERGD